MYERFYRLTARPFSLHPDPYFVFWGRNHSYAYSMLEYGIFNQAGFTVITGEIGCGKTTLLRHLLHNLDNRITVGLISNTLMGQGALLEWVLLSLNQPFEHSKYVALLRQFQQFLIAEYEQGRHVVLMIDEAQNLDPLALEELRMLSNINADGCQLLQVILTGQPQLRVMLQRPELIQFAQRITSDFHLGPLTIDEVVQYIHHRTSLAGAKENIFTQDAAHMIAKLSGGIPRIINAVCDSALVYGYALQAKNISASVVQEVLNDREKFGLLPVRPAVQPRLINVPAPGVRLDPRH